MVIEGVRTLGRPPVQLIADDRVRQRLITESDEEAIRQQQKSTRKKGMLTFDELLAECLESWQRWNAERRRREKP